MISDDERDDAYRAIGRYVVTFSELVRTMRDIVCQHVAKEAKDFPLPSLLLGEATPQVIANAFFGMCRMDGDFDREEEKVARTLGNEVSKTIHTRNDIAHGDWWIGNIALEEGRKARVMPPRLVRTLPARSEGPRKILDLSVEDIDALSDGLDGLLPLIEEFGNLALKQRVFAADESPRVSAGKYRVRDVLTVTGGKKSSAAKVARNGPHADRVFGSPSSLPSYASRKRARSDTRTPRA